MSLTVPLYGSNPRRKRIFWLIQGGNGLLLIVVAVLQKPQGWISLVLGIYGFLSFMAALLSSLFDKAYYLVIDQDGIRGQIGWRRRIELAWKEIVGAELSTLHLRLETADNQVQDISLGNLTYAQHQELKPQLQAVLEEHDLLSDTEVEGQNE